MQMHLFIVNERTLPVHLEYGFAGVSKDKIEDPKDAPWLSHTDARQERPQVSLYADICRVKQGDELLFYLEKPGHDVGHEGGRFLGIFEVVSPLPFYEQRGAYLLQELGRPLIYRLLIRPKEIFQQGLTEWQTMDEMSDFKGVHDIPWTLIYRKMEGGRGCTPLLPHEALNIRKMLDLRNSGQRLNTPSVGFDSPNVRLEAGTATSTYQGSTTVFDRIDTHLKNLISANSRKWEIQLQAYLMQEIGRNQALTQLLFPNVNLTWVGNEIFAGAGKQSIDILVFSENGLNTFIHLIELKSVVADAEAAAQMNRYIKWLRAHIPGISVHQIIPTLIAPGVAQSFHDDMKVYLRGHGINQYKVIGIDQHLVFTPTVHLV